MLLPLGERVLDKISRVIDSELTAIQCAKMNMPLVHPAVAWKASGRWQQAGAELLRLTDRRGAHMCLAPTHEEVFTALVAAEVSSHRQLPLRLYQTGKKFRDEVRPRFGLLRAREFVMKDLYTFDVDAESALQTYRDVSGAYERILNRLGLPWMRVEADSGLIGGDCSHEYHVPATVGEDMLLHCDSCGYAANVERAVSRTPPSSTPSEAPQGVAHFRVEIGDATSGGFTTSVRTVQLALPVGCAPNSTALAAAYGVLDDAVRVAPIAAADALPSSHAAANVEVLDLAASDRFRLAAVGDGCSKCDGGHLQTSRGIEVGHVFVLGEKYSRPLRAQFAAADGSRHFMHMGCYGLGLSRLIATAAEAHHDTDGLCWPDALAPFRYSVVPLVDSPQCVADAIALANNLASHARPAPGAEPHHAQGEVIFDDRTHLRASVRLKDAALQGHAWLLLLGKEWQLSRKVEVQHRASRQKWIVPLADVAELVSQAVPVKSV